MMRLVQSETEERWECTIEDLCKLVVDKTFCEGFKVRIFTFEGMEGREVFTLVFSKEQYENVKDDV